MTGSAPNRPGQRWLHPWRLLPWLAAALFGIFLTQYLEVWRLGAEPVASIPVPAPGRVILLVAEGLSWASLDRREMPNLRTLAARGSIGAMNVRVPAQAALGGGHLTLAAGTRLAGDPAAGLVMETGENLNGEAPNGRLRRSTGGSAPPGGAAFLGLPAVYRRNQEASYSYQIGALAESLARAGLKTGAVGNSDRPGTINRPGAALAADSLGSVPLARLAGLNRPDPNFPLGIRSDYPAFLAAVDDLLSQARLLVVELGDFSRLNQGDDPVLPPMALQAERLVAAEADRFLGDLAGRLDPARDILILAVPAPDQEALARGDLLTFCLFWGQGYGPGLLHSPATRRAGLLANTDLAPTILNLFGIDPPRTMVGRPVTGGARTPGSGGVSTWTYLFEFHRRVDQVQAIRRPVLKVFMMVEVLALTAFLIGTRFAPELVPGLYPVLLFLTCVPLGLLFWPGWLTAAAAITVFLTVTAVLTAIALWVERLQRMGGALAISALTWGAIVVDTLTGARLMMVSPLGYSPSGGARYYGIGNEYMGVLIGSTIILASLLWDRPPGRSGWPRPWPIALMILTGSLLAWPDGGANFGGALAAGTGFGAFAFGLTGQRANLNTFFIAGLIVLIAGAATVAIDLARPEPSYLGRAFLMVAEQGAPALEDIIQRKVAMNLRLIRYTNWTLVLMASLVTMVYLAWRPGGFLSRVAQGRLALRAGMAGLGAGGLAALVFNDSGVVAAATLLMLAKAPLASLWLEERQ